MEQVRIDGILISPAKVEGSPDVFQCPQFTLVKPSWVPDESARQCELCATKFTQLKRRHHCRMCGEVRCNKCCSDKITLPQLGIEMAERVCDSCRTVTELVTKSRSSFEANLTDSAKGLASFAKHDKHMKKLLELGGVQALIGLSSLEVTAVQLNQLKAICATEEVKFLFFYITSALGHVISGLQSLSNQIVLHKYLADAGAIKAVCKILSTVGDKNEQIALDGISTLKIFCASPSLKLKALSDGGLQPVLSLCCSRSDAVAMIAVQILSLIADNPASHQAIFDNRLNILPRLLQMTSCHDESLQEVALRTLAVLSTGSQQYKHRIVQEDLNSGRGLLRVLESKPNNPQIMCNMACLLANLSTNFDDQAELQEMMHVTCKILPSAEGNTELLCHLTRALANMAVFKTNVPYLTNYVKDIIRFCLKSSVAPVQLQSMRLILNLLAGAPVRTATLLQSEGASTFLTLLGELSGFVDAVQNSFITEAPFIAKPL